MEKKSNELKRHWEIKRKNEKKKESTMKKVYKQMERVYLLNVLTYINEIKTTRTFLEINHKCREVGQMLRIYSMKSTVYNCF